MKKGIYWGLSIINLFHFLLVHLHYLCSNAESLNNRS